MPRTTVWSLNLPNPNPGSKPPEPPPVRYLNLPYPNPSLIIHRLRQITANNFFEIRPKLTVSQFRGKKTFF